MGGDEWEQGGKGGASHCENTALATSFEISSTRPLEPPILKENRKTAARKMKKGRIIIKKVRSRRLPFIFHYLFFLPNSLEHIE